VAKHREHDDRSPILEELHPGARRLYFLFGGINSRVGMPQFEFYRSAQILEEHRIFLRDFSQSWYQRGLPGIAADAAGIADYLKARIDALEPEEVVLVGNSMGGFAAIMFAAMIGRGHAVAFAPQVTICPQTRLTMGDFRWTRRLLPTWAATVFGRHQYDLAPLLKRRTEGEIAVDLYYSKQERLDRRHAESLEGLPNVRLHPFDVGGHMLVRHLRDTGMLSDLLRGGAGP
jgi:pimeloyl-ACP methyl ester carboxylesterase